MTPFVRYLAIVLGLCVLAGCKKASTTPTPLPNRPPLIGALAVSPHGIGLQSATVFTFTAQNVSDPDGDVLTYSWVSSDGKAIASNTQAASHVYTTSNTFEMRVTVTDPGGLSASAAASISVGTLTGVWDVNCARTTYAIQACSGFPSQFVVTMSQADGSLFGSMTGGGRTRSFTIPGSVRAPRDSIFGVESLDNVFCGPNFDNDFYFHLTANETLTSMTSTRASQYCSAAAATKR